MKILIVTNYLPKYSIQFLEKLNHNLLYNKSRLYVIADTKSKTDVNQYSKEITFKVINQKLKKFFFLNYRSELLKRIKMIKPDKIIFYGNPRDLSVYSGLIFCKLNNINSYVYGMFHRIGGTKISTKFCYYLFSFLSKGCLTYGYKGFKNLVSLGINFKHIHIVGNAIDEKKITKIKKKSNNNLKILKGLKKKFPKLKSNIILQVVRMSAIKKPLLLIEAARILLKKRNDISFVIIGKGELFEKFNKLVKKYQLDNFFIILENIYDENQLAKWFLASKCLVVPACIGLSIHHSFAYGVPVITDDDDITQSSESELLKDGYNGLRYESNNSKDLSSKINLILKKNKLQKKMSKNALKTLYTNNKLEDKVARFIRAIDCTTSV